ncbi:MAG: hypothetical protein WDW38_009584 [Sanguina aurantia]
MLDAESDWQQTRVSSYGSVPGTEDGTPAPNSRLQRSGAFRRSAFSSAAQKVREAQRLKTLQRTPYPLVLARIKLLLDRMHVLLSQPPPASRGGTSSFSGGGGSRSAVPSRASSIRGASASSLPHAASGRQESTDSLPPSPRPATPSQQQQQQQQQARRAHGQRGGGETGAGSGGGLERHKAAGASVVGLTPGVAAMTPAHRQEATRSVASPSEQDEGLGGRNMTMERVLEELSVTFFFVSEFMRRVADDCRIETCFVSTLESYKKEQIVFKNGDVADKFYIILIGSVDIWSSLPGSRTPRYHICTFKKGSSFGERAILNGEERQECAVPSSNCTFLTVGCWGEGQ